MAEKKMGAGEAIVTLLIGGAAVWYLWGGGFEKQTTKSIDDAQKKVAQDLEEQYDIVSRNGSATDKCMHANIIAGSYLGRKDELNYAKWKKIATADCKAVGVNLD